MISNTFPFFFSSIRYLFLFFFFFSCILSTTHVYTILSTSSLFPTPPPSRRLSHSFILSFFLFRLFPEGSLNSKALRLSQFLLSLFFILPELFFVSFFFQNSIETEIEISLYGSYSSNVLPFLSLHAFHVKHQV